MRINQKNLIIQIMIIISTLSICCTVVHASGLEILNTNYTLIESKSDETKQYCNIFITVENQDQKSYQNMTIELIDEWALPVRQSYDFKSLEKKTFTFEEVPLAGGNIHQITVNIYPTNRSLTNSANSGSTTFNITYTGTTITDTPFVNPVSVIITTIIIALIIRKKSKMKFKN